MKRLILKAFLVVLLVAPATAFAPTAAFAGMTLKGKPKISFDSSGPGGLKIVGKTSTLEIDENEDRIIFKVDMDTVTTGIALRDNHMRDKYVQTKQFKYVELELAPDALTFPDGKKAATGKVKAKFRAHGVEKEVELTYTIKKGRSWHSIEGSFPYNTTDHGIDIPSYLGVTVYPDMTANAKFKVKLTDEEPADSN